MEPPGRDASPLWTVRQREVMAAAMRVLDAEGLRGLTMRRVAAQVGVSATALYRHFEDRDALIRALLVDAGDALGASFFGALEASSPQEALIATGEAYLNFARTQPAAFDLLFGSWRELRVATHGSAGPPEDGRPPISPSLRFLMDRIAACLGHPVGEEELLELALEQWALVHGLATLRVHGGGDQALSATRYDELARSILARAAARLAAERSTG